MESNAKGVTLIELLIAAALVSVIFGVAFMFYYFGTISFDNESTSANNQQNLRLAMNDITREIRNTSSEITVDHANSTLTIGSILYKLEDNAIKKNSNVLMGNVGKFDVSKNGNIISIEIESKANRSGHKDSLKTTIAIRK